MGIFSKLLGKNEKRQNATPIINQKPPVIEKPKGIFEIGSQYDFLTFNAAGVTFNNGRKSRQTILRRIKFGDEPFEKDFTVTLVQYDFEGSPAISINALDQQIGNVPIDFVQAIIENKNRIDALTEFSIHGGGDHSFGAKLILRFLKNPKEEIHIIDTLVSTTIPTNFRDYSKAKSFRLTANSNEEMQDNIGMVSKGDEVEFDMDYDKDKYLAWAGASEIGYLPQSGTNFLEAIGENYEADIESIDINDNDKYVVTVRILPM